MERREHRLGRAVLWLVAIVGLGLRFGGVAGWADDATPPADGTITVTTDPSAPATDPTAPTDEPLTDPGSDTADGSQT